MQRVWKARELSAPAALPGLPPLLARLYAARGVTADSLPAGGLAGLAPAAALRGLDAALSLLEQALRQDWRILIIGDFDADGATSTALSVRALRALGARHVDFLVPNRFTWGYGLTPGIVAEALREKRPDLIITVDNGIASHDGVAAAQAAGVRVLITDHHLPGDTLPAADAIVNPNQPGCDFPSKHLAGVGVVFYLLSALRTRLRQQGWFVERGLAEPNMADHLDLVALGTVADVASLDANNRLLVQQGLARMRAGRCCPGITALLKVAERDPSRLVASDLGFVVAPRLNAAGRLDDMAEGIHCLLSDDPDQALRMARELDALNLARRDIEGGMQQEAMSVLQSLQFTADTLPDGLVLYDRHWHQGVIGILAGRIKERYHRPVIAFAPAQPPAHGEMPAELKGSARSIPGVHVRDVLDAVATRHPGLITRFGGHAMAAGLSLPSENLAAFREAFTRVLADWVSPELLQAVLLHDGELGPAEITDASARLLRDAGPWGQGFPEPLFVGEFLLLEQRLLKERHLKMSVCHPDSNRVLDAIAFGVDRSVWPRTGCQRVRLAYRLDLNQFRGMETLQLRVEDLQPA
ncbi:single-stranded-DNA-specific exonuclease RecJ [Perlucidibaca piscinae]|uniref:single-stranded-DNA-specific exonuclease RecJ n=1 Tax=Perlucidibaca piscinae TaxID=392589 RepID=UPI0003B6B264|nr:single-stranded-DNA-specific exonuclease RecJ [Perlucidibaca piscinae]